MALAATPQNYNTDSKEHVTQTQHGLDDNKSILVQYYFHLRTMFTLGRV